MSSYRRGSRFRLLTDQQVLFARSLNSLYSLFAFTREVLREAGPDVAHGPKSFGPVAIDVLTRGVAPFTTKWHQTLLEHEMNCPAGVSALEHEHDWVEFEQMVRELEQLQGEMRHYADALKKIAAVEM
jgi:hypothetical protein